MRHALLLAAVIGEVAAECTVNPNPDGSTYLAPHAFGLRCKPAGCCRAQNMRAWLSGSALDDVESAIEVTAPGLHTLRVEGIAAGGRNVSWRYALLDPERTWSEWGLRPRSSARPAAAPPLPRSAEVAQALALATVQAKLCATFDVRYGEDTHTRALPLGITTWNDNACIYVGIHLRVGAGSELRIGSGTTVLFAAGGRGALLVLGGRLAVNGSVAAPAIFDVQAADRNAKWHGIAIAGFFSTARIQHAVIRNTGGGTRTLDVGEFHHPNAVAALHCGEGARVELLDVIITDGRGQGITVLGGLGGRGARASATHVVIRRCHIARFRLGIEMHNATAAILDSVLESFGDARTFADDDNDALYIAGGEVAIQNCTVANAGDDCIDAGSGWGGRLWIDRTVVRNCVHEGIALMNKGGVKSVVITNTVVSDAQQGIELGCASAETSVVVSRSVVEDCRVGVRYGDNNPGGAEGCPHDGELRIEASTELRRNDDDVLNLVFEQSQGHWRGGAPGRFVNEAQGATSSLDDSPELAVVYDRTSAQALLGVSFSIRKGRAMFAASKAAGTSLTNMADLSTNMVETQIMFDLEGLVGVEYDFERDETAHLAWDGPDGRLSRRRAVLARVRRGLTSFRPFTIDLGIHLRPSILKWGAARGGPSRKFVVGEFNLFENALPAVAHNPLDVTMWIDPDVVEKLLGGRPIAYIRGPRLHYVEFGNHKYRTANSGTEAQALERSKALVVHQREAESLLNEVSRGDAEEPHHYGHARGLPLCRLRVSSGEVSSSVWTAAQFDVSGATEQGGVFAKFAASGVGQVKSFGASSAASGLCTRSSFLLRVEGNASKLLGPRAPALREVALLSLCQDRGMLRNLAALHAARELGLIASAFAMVELVGLGPIHAGMYLLAETPTAALRRRAPSTTAVLQRVNVGVAPIDFLGPMGFRHGAAKRRYRTTPFEESHDGLQAQTASYTWCGGGDDDAAQPQACRADARSRFHRVVFNATHGELVGEELVRALRAAFDLDGYLRYAALNTALMNGDAQDELYFAEVDGTYAIHAWDFDDVGMPCRTDRPLVRDPLLHCPESALDARLRDPSVRGLFRLALEGLVADGGVVGVRGIFEQQVASNSKRLQRILRERPALGAPLLLLNANAVPRFAAELIMTIRERRATLRRRLRYENDIFGGATSMAIGELRAAELRAPETEQLRTTAVDPTHDAALAEVLRSAPIVSATSIKLSKEDARNRDPKWLPWPNALVTVAGGTRALLQIPGKPYHLDVANRSCAGVDARHAPIASTGAAQAAAMHLDRLLRFNRVPVSVVRRLTAAEVAALPLEMHRNAESAATMQREDRGEEHGANAVQSDDGLDVTVVEWVENACDARTRCGANPLKWNSAAQGKALGMEDAPEWSWRNNYLPLRPDRYARIDRLLEWSDMAVFDHVAGNIDRCPHINTLTRPEAASLGWDYQCNNLHVLGEDGPAVWLDVDETFHMQSVVEKWRDPSELYMLCVFRASTIQRLAAWSDAEGATLVAQAYRRHGVGSVDDMASFRSLGAALQARLRAATGVELPDVLAEGVDARVKFVLDAVDYCVGEYGVQDVVLP